MPKTPTALLLSAALLSGALFAGFAPNAQAQTVSSTNGSYAVTFTEATTNVGGSSPFLYTYNATLGSTANGAFVNGLTFVFANPNAYNALTAFSPTFDIVNQTGNSITFVADSGNPGLSAANPTATFSFQSAFAPTTTPTALAITPAGGSTAGPGPGIGGLFVGPSASPTAAPEPGAWTALGLGAFGLLGLTARARRASARI